jgi:hypothetical protein
LGGQSGVTEIAAALIDRAAADPVLGRSFHNTNLKRIEKLLAEQLCDQPHLPDRQKPRVIEHGVLRARREPVHR